MDVYQRFIKLHSSTQCSNEYTRERLHSMQFKILWSLWLTRFLFKKKALLIRRNSNTPPPPKKKEKKKKKNPPPPKKKKKKKKKNQPRFRRQGSCRKWETMVYISLAENFLKIHKILQKWKRNLGKLCPKSFLSNYPKIFWSVWAYLFF